MPSSTTSPPASERFEIVTMKRFEQNGKLSVATEPLRLADDVSEDESSTATLDDAAEQGSAIANIAAPPFLLPASAMLLLTEPQAAAYLNISARKLWELGACGAIPFVKIGAVKRYRRIGLEDWVGRGCPMTKPK